VNHTDDDTEEMEIGFSRVIVVGSDPHAWDWDSYSCSYPGFCFDCVVGVSGEGLRFAFGSSHGRVRDLSHDHRPWAL